MPADSMSGITSLILPLALVVIFVVLIIVPQRKRDKKVKEMLSNLRVNDNVKTIGGVYGKIIAVKDDLVTIETGPDKAKLVFAKGAVATVESNDVENEIGEKKIGDK